MRQLFRWRRPSGMGSSLLLCAHDSMHEHEWACMGMHGHAWACMGTPHLSSHARHEHIQTCTWNPCTTSCTVPTHDRPTACPSHAHRMDQVASVGRDPRSNAPPSRSTALSMQLPHRQTRHQGGMASHSTSPATAMSVTACCYRRATCLGILLASVGYGTTG